MKITHSSCHRNPPGAPVLSPVWGGAPAAVHSPHETSLCGGDSAPIRPYVHTGAQIDSDPDPISLLQLHSRDQFRRLVRLADLRHQALRYADLLSRGGKVKQAAAMAACCADAIHLQGSSGRQYARPTSRCQLRLCPMCCRRRAARHRRRFEPVLGRALAFGYEAHLLTLTVENPDTLTRSHLSDLFASWGKLRRRSILAPVLGSIASLEVKRSSRLGGWHAHLHVLLVVKSGTRFDYNLLRDAWESVTGGAGRYLHVVKARGDALGELLKYPLKVDEVGTVSPSDMSNLVDVLKGFKMVRCTGLFRGIEPDADDGTDLGDEDELRADDPERATFLGVYPVADLHRWALALGVSEQDALDLMTVRPDRDRTPRLRDG